MQLSMQMLRDWLSEYHPEADIRYNRRTLRNVRLFSENNIISPSTVYLATMEPDIVLCSNHNDILTVRTDDINEVFNHLLDAFEFYNNSEDDLNRRIQEGCTCGELLERFSELTGCFMILADAAFYMRDSAGPERVLRFHHGLKEMMGECMIPLSVIRRINASQEIRRRDLPPYELTVPEIGTALIANLFAEENHAGWMVCLNESGVFREGEKDLMEALSRVMERWLIRNKAIEERSEKAGMFLALLNEEEGSSDKLEERLSGFGWDPGDEKRIYVLRRMKDASLPEITIVRRLEHGFPDAFAFLFHRMPVLLCNGAVSDFQKVEKRLAENLTFLHCAAGASQSFFEIGELRSAYRTAELAAEYAPEQPGEILPFQDAVLPYTFRILKEHTFPDLRHRALTILKSYDEENGTNLAETLRIFLRESMSYTAASKALYIHRSTLIYRMERILELTGIDLADPDERFHLVLSFYMS